MKEATGELNMTVIVAISVGILMAFFFSFLWPALKGNFNQTANCKKATCDCRGYEQRDYQCECWIGERTSDKTFLCPYGG